MENKLKTLKIIHLVLCIGLIFAYTFMANLKSIKDLFNIYIETSLDYAFLLLPILAFVLSNFVYKHMLKSVNNNTSIDTKLSVFQTASIARWAILEGSALIILFIKPDFIIVGIIIIVYLFLLRPTEDKFNTDLNLL